MKLPVLQRFLCVLFYVVAFPLSSARASSPPDSIHFCAFDDHEAWERDHPRSAAKRPANLNAGEPRTVRMIYFLPKDRPYSQEVVDSMKVVIRRIQTFYREQMKEHEHGDTTFRIETDAQGEPMVHHVDGRHPESYYANDLAPVFDESEPAVPRDGNIRLIVLDNSTNSVIGYGGFGEREGKNSGYAVVPGGFSFATAAHELGHAFGLEHDFRDGAYIMSYGPGWNRLSACSAEFLSVHPYFNANTPIEDGKRPTVKLISPRTYPAGSRSVPVHFQVNDSRGLHQVSLRGLGGLIACSGLGGEKSALVEFDYDGAWRVDGLLPLPNAVAHTLFGEAVDTDGNLSAHFVFTLVESSPYRIATLEGNTRWLYSVAFSPVDATLAAGSTLGTVKLWDVDTQQDIGTLEGHTNAVRSVAFSSDGRILASGSSDHTVRLWDVDTQQDIGTLKGHADGVRSVAFSSDGRILASGSLDRTVRLWDMGSRELLGTLEGHRNGVITVAFSPDGVTLASGSWDGAVKLWDVGRRELVGKLAGHRNGVPSVGFSPDGATLASGSWDGTVKLWDVETQQDIGTLREHTGEVTSVAFSPLDPTLLASASNAEVKLWNVMTGANLASFGNMSGVYSVAFSSDGAVLASGTGDGTSELWDVSEWTGPRPYALEIVSGDGQQGEPGAELARSLVVEVRDQFGNLLPDSEVTFTVTAGEGRLSSHYSVENTTTDAEGRAEVILTLGPQPGPNIVDVSLGGRELATFTAGGVGTPVAELEGDYRTWHLPRAATVRLGKGALGESNRAVALSADGRYLAVASGIGVWLYEASTSRALALFPTEQPVHSVAFSLDGTLASGLDFGMVELWDVETGTSIGTLRYGDWTTGLTVVFSPDGRNLASRWRQEIKLWDVQTRRLAGTWKGPTGLNRHNADQSVAFSPDGTRLASGFEDGTVRLWDVAAQTEVATLKGHTDRVASVSFSPDGSLLASAGWLSDPTVRLWDAAMQTEMATLRGHTGEVRSVSFSSPDGATLASGSSDGTVRLWDVAAQEEIADLREHGAGLRSVAFSRDGATLVSAAANGTVLLREVETGNAGGPAGHTSLSSMAFSRDGVLLASGHQDGRIRLWDAATRTPIATLKGHTAGIGSVSFSSDGALLASGSWDRTVKLWDVGTRGLVGTLEGHRDGVTSVSFSPDGATLALAGGWNDATVRLWNVATREPIGTLEGHANEVRSLSFSSAGALLASGGGYDDKTVRLWNVAARELVGILEGHTGSVNAVAFSPDNALLASGSRDDITLWVVGTRQRRSSLNNGRTVNSLAFSADGKTLAAGTWGGATLWDVETREQIATLGGHTESVHSVAFSDDGAILATGASDGTILLWDVAQYLTPSMANPDFDGDGTVGFPDFLQFAVQFGLSKSDEEFDGRFDLDGNGAVGFSDFLIFAGAFGKSSS